MSTEVRPTHSPLGASGAERWMNCPGSVALLSELCLATSDEPEYRSLGTAAHQAAYTCVKEGLDAWEVMGQEFGDAVKHKCDEEMATAIQLYIDECRAITEQGGDTYLEFSIDAPDFHHDFYGTLDFGNINGTLMRVRDYKHGEGILVEIEWNPQLMYYAYGLLRHHPEVEEIELGVVQPRCAFHPDGPVRTWRISAEALRAWAENTLHGAMLRTSMDNDLDAGPWCRFCPAKLVCPLMSSLFGAAMTADPKRVPELTDASLGRSYQYVQAAKFYLKALEEEVFNRLNNGTMKGHGVKLVQKKANRVWRGEAQALLVDKLGDQAFTKPEFKSPAEMEKISPEIKKLVHANAYTPMSGLTVALESDRRLGIDVKKVSETFAGAVAALVTPEGGTDEQELG